MKLKTPSFANNNLHFFLLIMSIFSIIWIILFALAIDKTDWWIENILVFIIGICMYFIQKKYPLSHTSILCVFVFATLHLFGATAAYTKNSFGAYLQLTYHLQRNPYDRIVHYSFGFFMAYPIYEWMIKYVKIKKSLVVTIVFMGITTLATIFELIEWGVASFTNSATGQTYVATQGDPWDAQKDIVLAMVGALLFVALNSIYIKIKNRFFYRFAIPTLLIIVSISCFSQKTFAQTITDSSTKIKAHRIRQAKRNGIWFTPTRAYEINGLVLGTFSSDLFYNNDSLQIKGLQINIDPFGIIALPYVAIGSLSLINKKDSFTRFLSYPDSAEYYSNNTFYGLKIDVLAVTSYNSINGVCISTFFTRSKIFNGLSITVGQNNIYQFEGLLIAGLMNNVNKGSGVQIALFNKCADCKGVQIGLLNKMKNRTTPFINFRL